MYSELDLLKNLYCVSIEVVLVKSLELRKSCRTAFLLIQEKNNGKEEVWAKNGTAAQVLDERRE